MKNEAIKLECKTEALKARTLRQTARKYRADSDQEGVSKEERKALRKTANSLLYDANYDRDDRRHLHLAYCYLKGRTYLQCESKCAPDNKPSVSHIVGYIWSYDKTVPKDTRTMMIEFWVKAGELTRWQVEASYQEKEGLEKAEKALSKAKKSLEGHNDNLASYERQRAEYERRIADLDKYRVPQCKKDIESAQVKVEKLQRAYDEALYKMKQSQREPEYPLGTPAVDKGVAA
jgi:hypothetical protein